jgi:ketosteroid isomerase-like protein
MTWETRDPELIITIFTEEATYNDPKEPENFGRNAIKKYWETKVIGEQEDIKFTLLNL